MPLHGSAGRPGRDVARAVELALKRAGGTAPGFVLLDAAREVQAAENAARAAEDDAALAYIGDFQSAHVAQTAPILGRAGLLQIAPVATFAGLQGPTLVRLTPVAQLGNASLSSAAT